MGLLKSRSKQDIESSVINISDIVNFVHIYYRATKTLHLNCYYKLKYGI